MFNWFYGLTPHMKAAIFVAPLMFIIGWAVADFFSSDPKAEEKKVQFYELRQTGECRLSQAPCGFEFPNTKFEGTLTQEAGSTANLVKLVLKGNQHLRGVKISLVVNGGQEQHIIMNQSNTDTTYWSGEFPAKLITADKMKSRMALAQAKRVLYLEWDVGF